MRGHVVSRAVVIATGVTAIGDRAVLEIEAGDSEDVASWTAFVKAFVLALRGACTWSSPTILAASKKRPRRVHRCGLPTLSRNHPAQRPAPRRIDHAARERRLGRHAGRGAVAERRQPLGRNPWPRSANPATRSTNPQSRTPPDTVTKRRRSPSRRPTPRHEARSSGTRPEFHLPNASSPPAGTTIGDVTATRSA
jgi:hypothetical protein